MLISSNFLQIADAVEACTRFLSKQFIDVVCTTAMDITSLDPALLSRLARILPEATLEKMQGSSELQGLSKSRCNHIVSKMYKYKLGMLLKDLHTTVARCLHCKQYFSSAANAQVRAADIALGTPVFTLLRVGVTFL